MEKPYESVKIINMFLHPVFIVKDGMIVDMNNAAKAMEIQANTPISDIIPDALDEYTNYEGGYLSLNVIVNACKQLATVVRSEIGDIFHLRTADTAAEFRTMALISQQIRKPLAGIMSAADSLFPAIVETNNATQKEQVAQINRNLYQILREVSNLSSAQNLACTETHHMQMQFLTGTIREAMTQAVSFAEQSGRTLQFTDLPEDVHGIADNEFLERAVFNLVSNALKFSPAGSVVSAKLTCSGAKLRFSVRNQTDKYTDLSNLYARFMREPGIEDGRHGIGLGIPLVQHIAALHGGSLLMDHPEENTVRFTMTIPIRQTSEGILRSPTMLFDYLGGHNHALVELSDVLPWELYSEYL